MRRFDKKANIAEANRLADEAFMKEREMMGIASPVKEEAPEYMGDQPSFDIEGAINSLITDEVRGGIEQMTSSECEILFEAEKFSLVVNCSIEVDERPYYEEETNSGTNGSLTITIDGGMMMVDKEDNEQDEIALTAEQLKPLEERVNEVMNEDDNLYNYFENDGNGDDDGSDPDDYYDRSREEREFGGMDEEINEIKRITKRLLGE
jgi:hypothetical protein